MSHHPLIQVIQAQPGYFTVIDIQDERNVVIGSPIIGWRVETHLRTAEYETFSYCVPLTVDGDVPSNCIGVQNPDMSVRLFDTYTADSLAALQASRYP